MKGREVVITLSHVRYRCKIICV